MHYKFINNLQELISFLDILKVDLQPYEMYSIMLVYKKKYLTEGEKTVYSFPTSGNVERLVIRESDPQEFVRKLRRLECSKGSYLDRKGNPFSQKVLVPYLSINPLDGRLAYANFASEFNDRVTKLMVHKNQLSLKKFSELDVRLFSHVSKNRSRRVWKDLDFDVPKEVFLPYLMKGYLDSKGLKYIWLDTKSGYHLLVKTESLTFDPKDICSVGEDYLIEHLVKLGVTYLRDHVTNQIVFAIDEIPFRSEAIVNNMEMIPIPGTYQGEYPVSCLMQYSNI